MYIRNLCDKFLELETKYPANAYGASVESQD